jgi:hypothetical protein
MQISDYGLWTGTGKDEERTCEETSVEETEGLSFHILLHIFILV